METGKEKALFVFAAVGCIADIIAIIFLFINANISIAFLVLTIIILVFLIIFLCWRYIERCNFIKFIEYLFDNPTHNFNLLPKICLELDKYKEVNNLKVISLTVRYTYDMSELDFSSITKNSEINYTDVIEYDFTAENEKIPSEFVCYLGNMYAENCTSEISQKHGIQNEYELVPPPRYTDEIYVNSAIQKYSWQFKKENITKGNQFPFSFKLKCQEKTKENSSDTIIFYPKQYAKRLEKVKFDISFVSDKKILNKVQLFKVWKDGKDFKHTPISESLPVDNNFSVTIQPDSVKYEAYYFRIYWRIIDDI